MAIPADQAPKRKLLQFGDAAIAWIWLAVATLTILGAIAIAYVGSPGAPYWDQWLFVDPPTYLRDMFVRSNGHPMELARVLFATDYYVFGARGWWLQWVMFFSLGACAAGFAALARLGGLKGPALAVCGAFAATLLFQGQGWECLRWPFQPPFVIAFTAPVIGAYALAAHTAKPRASMLALSLAASVLSMFALSNGVFASVLLCAMAAYLRQPVRVIALYALVALLAIPVFATPNIGPVIPLEFNPLALLYFVFRYVAGGVASTLGMFLPSPIEAFHIAWWLGLALVLASIALVARVVLANKRDPSAVALVAIIIFTGLTAALTALGRASVSADLALASRYVFDGAVLLPAVVLLAALEFSDFFSQRPLLTRTIVALVALIALVFPLSAGKLAGDLASRAQAETAAQTAMVVGVRDEKSIGMLAFNLDMATDGAASLRAAHKWFFTDPWSRAIGQHRAFAGLPACSGGDVSSVDDIRAADGYVQLLGWISPADARRGRTLLVVRNDEIVGYGVVYKQVSDLTGGLLFSPMQYDWRAHVLIHENADVAQSTAYLASEQTPLCRIGPPH